MLVSEGHPMEEGWPTCRLCQRKLDRENCKWKIFPNICLDCAPPGIEAKLPGEGWNDVDERVRHGMHRSKSRRAPAADPQDLMPPSRPSPAAAPQGPGPRPARASTASAKAV